MDDRAIRDYQEAIADATIDAVWIEDELPQDPDGRVKTTADAGSWLEIQNELSWIA